MQIDHQAQRSITFQIRDAFNDFLRQLHDADESVPGAIQDIERQLGYRLVVADRTDPEGVGFVQWRPAFYIAGLSLSLSLPPQSYDKRLFLLRTLIAKASLDSLR